MTSEDWDAYWRFERFRRLCDPLDFRRWKRDSQRALRELHPGRVRLLDATAGMGDHTVNLAEEGFTVEATDSSPVARAQTREAVHEAGLDVDVHAVPWEELGRLMPARFDLIFNDALHWIEDEEEMRAALQGMHGALREGGSLVFFFADARESEAHAGLRLLEWDWEHMDAHRQEWSHEHEGVRVTLTVDAELGERVIDEHHHFTVEGESALRDTHLTMRRIYRWDWAALAPLMREVGFSDVRSGVFENRAKRYTFAMNHATR